MRISITCPKCKHDFSAPDNLAGRRAKCPECGEGVRVIDNGLTSDSGETSTRPRRARGGSPKGLIVVGVIAALVAGAAGLNHLQGLLQTPVPIQQPAQATNPAQPAAQSSSNSNQAGIRPAPEQASSEPETVQPEMVADTWEDYPALADEPENLKPIADGEGPSRVVALTREEAVEEFDTMRGKVLLARMTKMSIVRDGETGYGGAANGRGPEAGFQPDKLAGAPNVGGIQNAKSRKGKKPPRLQPKGKGYGAAPPPGGPRSRKNDDDEDKENEDPVWKRLVERCKSTLKVKDIMSTTDAPDRNSAVLTVVLQSQPKVSEDEESDSDMMVWTIAAELVCADLSEDPTRPEYAKVWKAEQELGTLSQKLFDDGKLSKSVGDGLNEFFISLRAARVRAEKAVKEANEADTDSSEADD